jgi:hypothetical protein
MLFILYHWGRRGRDRMVVGFTTTCAIRPIPTKVVSSNPTHGERCTRYNIMWWGLSVTCDRLVVFSGYSGSSTNKTDCHIITEILFKVALNTITLTLYHSNEFPQVVAMISLFHYNIKYILDIIDSTLSENSHSSLHV